MITNPSSSALNLISSAQNKAAGAAQTIAKLPIAESKEGNSNFATNDIIKPLLSLKEAEIETSAAVEILKTQDEMLGSLFDAIS